MPMTFSNCINLILTYYTDCSLEYAAEKKATLTAYLFDNNLTECYQVKTLTLKFN